MRLPNPMINSKEAPDGRSLLVKARNVASSHCITLWKHCNLLILTYIFHRPLHDIVFVKRLLIIVVFAKDEVPCLYFRCFYPYSALIFVFKWIYRYDRSGKTGLLFYVCKKRRIFWSWLSSKFFTSNITLKIFTHSILSFI